MTNNPTNPQGERRSSIVREDGSDAQLGDVIWGIEFHEEESYTYICRSPDAMTNTPTKDRERKAA